MRAASKSVLRITAAIAVFFGIGEESSAFAQEAATYSYDALGRLVTVNRSGGPNGTAAVTCNGVAATGICVTYQYDAASNRSNVTVTGSPNGNATSVNADNGASVPPTMYVVVPLNGFTVIRIPQ